MLLTNLFLPKKTTSCKLLDNPGACLILYWLFLALLFPFLFSFLLVNRLCIYGNEEEERLFCLLNNMDVVVVNMYCCIKCRPKFPSLSLVIYHCLGFGLAHLTYQYRI